MALGETARDPGSIPFDIRMTEGWVVKSHPKYWSCVHRAVRGSIMDKKFFTADELIATFGLTRGQIESLVGDGKLKALADRGTFKYRRDEIEALIAGGLAPQGTPVDLGSSESDVISFDFDGEFDSPGAEAVSFLEIDEEALAGAPTGKDSSSDVSIIDDGDDDLMGFLSQLEDDRTEEAGVPVVDATRADERQNSLADLFSDDQPDETAGGTDLDLSGEFSPSAEVAAASGEPQTADDGFVAHLLSGDDAPATTEESGIGLDFPAAPTTLAGRDLDAGDENEETGIRLERPEEVTSSSLMAGTGFTGDSSLRLGMEDSGLSLDVGEPDLGQPNTGESGIVLDTSSESSLRMSTADSGLSLDTGDSGLSLDTGDSGLSLDTGDSGLSLDVGDSGLSLDVAAEDGTPAPTAEGTQRIAVGGLADDDFDLSDELSLQDEESLAESSSTRRLAREEQFQEEDLFATQLNEEAVDEVSEEDVTQMLILGDDEADETATTQIRGGKAKGRKPGISDEFDVGEAVDDLELTDDLEDAVIGGFDDDDEVASLDDDELLIDDEDDAVMADDDDFSEEALPTRGSAKAASSGYALPSFGLPTTIALCLGGLFVVLNGWLVWEATATMWTGAEPSSAAASIIDSLAGLIG
ncbi:MAG: hypothetical protein C0478_11715 [Planctomyces sp.]|nr:hypothetical protein [Planctomyces sp.]